MMMNLSKDRWGATKEIKYQAFHQCNALDPFLFHKSQS